ncbi:wd repeat-containing protein 5 [Ceraceosorus bombacis]|uniref:Wd repeat-containing protein 5 n=1 Tax=Ceraceosorus bombacis TaxID=401625 RepID=A0A0P1BPX4_9BASI|nr:wd repeat-containing protein 5 [Ceraceosorus bombacis]
MDVDSVEATTAPTSPLGPTKRECYVLRQTLQGHTRSVSSLSISPHGMLLASSGSDRTIKIWNLASGSLKFTLKGHKLGVNQVAWSGDGRYVASASDDRTVRVWDCDTGAQVRLLQGHTSYVFCLAYNLQCSLIVSGSFDETIRLWDVKRGICHKTIPAHSEAVTGVDFNRDGDLIVSCSYDGLLRLWDTSTGTCLKTLVHRDNAPLSHVKFTPSSSQILASSLDNTIRLWDIPNSRVLKTYTGNGYTNGKFACAADFTAPRELPSPTSVGGQGMDEDPRKQEMRKRGLKQIFVVAGSEDQRVYVWDLQSKKVDQILVGHRDVVIAIAAHPTLDIIASASMDHDPSIKIWSLDDIPIKSET